MHKSDGIGNKELTEEQFYGDLKETVLGQYDECKAYQIICRSRGFNPERDLEGMTLGQMPYLTSNTFKRSVAKFPLLIRVPGSEIDIWTASSGTSGDPSIVGRRKKEIDAYKTAYAWPLNDFTGGNYELSLLFFPRPDDLKKMSSGEYMGKPVLPFFVSALESMGTPRNPENKIYLLKPASGTGRLEPDIPLFVRYLKEAETKGTSVLVGGSTPLTFSVLTGLHQKTGLKIDLGKNSYIGVGAGGWDGKKGNVDIGKPISKKEFAEGLSKILNIPTQNIFDGYGFTETPSLFMSHYSKKLEEFLYHDTPWSKIILRDPDTLEVIKDTGKPGLIEVVTPYGVGSYAGVAILVDDVGQFIEMRECSECGRKGNVFKIIGRAEGAEAKGCGAFVAELTNY